MPLYGRSTRKWPNKMWVKMKIPKTDKDGGSVMETQRLKQAVILREFPKGFFNPVIPRVFWQPTPPAPSRAYRQSPNSPWFCFKIPNPERQIRESRIPRNLLGTLFLARQLACVAAGIFLCVVPTPVFGSRLCRQDFNRSPRQYRRLRRLHDSLFKSRQGKKKLPSVPS